MPETDPITRPVFRDHNTYKQDAWTVVDVDNVDRVFATRSPSSDASDGVRIDLDGALAASVMRDVGQEGEPVNMSIWLDTEDAKTLVAQVVDALPTPPDE